MLEEMGSEDANFDISFVPPSPPRSVHDDFDQQSPFNIAEFDIHGGGVGGGGGPLNALKSPPFAAPHTPSYNGSYYNSPFSQHSELSFTGEELNFELLQGLDLDMGLNDYEPSEYEAGTAAAGGGLLLFPHDATTATTDYTNFTTTTGAPDHHRSKGSPFDHSSPSDNGDEQLYDIPSFTNSDNRGQHQHPHSRASSVNPSPQHSPSPRPTQTQSQDVTHSFMNISIHTPSWGTQALPQASPQLAASVGQKAQSPPRLLMPEGILDSAKSISVAHHQRSRSDEAMLATAVPQINAPDEEQKEGNDDQGRGPSFHFVPPTPVSGAGDERQGVPFQHTLTTLVQGAELTSHHLGSIPSSPQPPSTQPSPSPSPGQQGSRPNSRQPSPFQYEFPRNNVDEGQRQQPVQPASRNINTQGGYNFPDMSTFLTGGGQSVGLGLGVEQQQQQPQQGRQRSSSHSNTWNLGGFEFSAQQHHQNPAQQQQQQRAQLNAFTFGGAGSSAQNSNNNNGGGYLSPELGGGMMQRAVSESLAVGGRSHRLSRSEDISGLVVPNPNGGPAGFTAQAQAQLQPQQPQQGQSQGSYGHHQNSLSVGGGFDFHQQYLHPNNQLGVASSRRSLSPAGAPSSSHNVGHFRRLSSGSRSDRGAEVWGTAGGSGGGGAGGGASGSHLTVQRRVSPYPSPNASPRVRYQELEDEDGGNGGRFGTGLGGGGGGGPSALLGLGVGASSMTLGLPPSNLGEPPSSAGFTEEIGITGRGAYSSSQHNRGASGGSIHDGASSHGGRDESPTSVGATDAQGNAIAKQNVTTGRTANASIRRRKQDANFACTVPGCNSTFTRGFNLKGHLRSHYEQKPYKCHWPGCGKGFARQHDCKRHEQLHSNFRPFECEGCRKQFARMDALNRHLRSEAGAECARVVERVREEGRGAGIMDGDGDVSMMGGAMGMGVEEHEALVLPPTTTTTRPSTRRRNTGGASAAAAQAAAQMLGDDEWMSVAV